MLKIGEFSKLSHLTVKALRFYEKKGLLIPASADGRTGYRFYETAQLQTAAKIKAYRQLGFSVDEIRLLLSGTDSYALFRQKAASLEQEQNKLAVRLSIIHHLLEEKNMKYQVVEKTIPACIVYCSEATLKNYADMMQFIPACGEECIRLNPDLHCAEPGYEFLEFLDGEFKTKNVRVRHNEAVTRMGKESDNIHFKHLPQTRVLSVFHKGAYENIGEAYAYLAGYAGENGYRIAGNPRECYIDGIWNKENIEDWLTEVQLPIE